MNIWNSHEQDNLFLPTGVPNHMFSFPENYGGQNLGIPVSNDQLKEVAELSGLLELTSPDNISTQVRRECKRLIDNPSELDPHQAKTAYLFLKQTFPQE